MSFKYLYSLLLLGFILLGTNFQALSQGETPSGTIQAGSLPPGTEEHKLNVAQEIFGHVADAHEWHIFTLGHTPFAIPLPVIIYHPTKGLSIFSSSRITEGESYDGYYLQKVDMTNSRMKEKIVAEDGAPIRDFSITKNTLSMFLSLSLLLWIMTSVAGKYKKGGVMAAPSGMQNFIEVVIVFIRDQVAKPAFGEKKYIMFMPLLLTMFFFIWINNLFGLLPFGFNLTGNIAVTCCLALVSFAVIVFKSNKHFWLHIINPPGVPLGVKFILVPIEIISLFIKPAALMIRLFANIIAGHIVILSLICIIFIFSAMSVFVGSGFAPVSLAFVIFMFMLELLVGAIQAFIFVNLTAVFIGQAMEGSHDTHGAHGDLVI